ncbi:hypothetical protein GUJ93_ZPchr0002g25069 [Zizania palustris]|uniref:Cation/H+ exchanger transmembrane domain-containing protein n=1 Tax=Zizania palustris TaxID=103762 RepID=A0A8J5VQL2_ZIZPA|nr:hypothetical protein GUJ93_ZPchr0002g25069 [Zizania palustris]
MMDHFKGGECHSPGHVIDNFAQLSLKRQVRFEIVLQLEELLKRRDAVSWAVGFSLSPKPFFANFGAIVTFSILGTFIASIVTGILVFLGGLTFLMYKLPFVECLMFGALISATDPVTVLSIFQVLWA